MRRLDGRKAQLPVSGIVQIAFISILGFIIFSAQAYGSTDIPVNIAATPVTIEESALFAGFGGGSGLNNQGFITAANGIIGSRAASTFLTAFYDQDTVHTEQLIDIEPLNGTTDTSHSSCTDSCSL